MDQIYRSPDLQISQAKERMKRLQDDAIVYESNSGQSWRKRTADSLIRIAEWLEPTLKNPSGEDITTSLSK